MSITTGIMTFTPDARPFCGKMPDIEGLYHCSGFSGHGIALATIAGKLIAEAIAGQSERFDVFARLEHRNFPGGRLLRTPALVLAMMWYRIRDLL